MNILKFFGITIAAGFLTACGGGTTGYSTNNAGFEAIIDGADALTARLETSAPTELAQTPTGSAEFRS